MKDWYLEYSIRKNKPGLLGEIASLLGMLKINIVTVNSIDSNRRGFLLKSKDNTKIAILKNILGIIDHIKVTALRPSTFLDEISLRHGKSIEISTQKRSVYKFTREEIGLLVDFVGELLRKDALTIGIRGMPKVGKTEAAIAACVNANKRWVLISATIFQPIVRTHLTEEEMNADCVYLIDGIHSAFKGNKEHLKLVKQIMERPNPKIIEHPDILVEQCKFNEKIYDAIIEIRRNTDEEINYDKIPINFISFDI